MGQDFAKGRTGAGDPASALVDQDAALARNDPSRPLQGPVDPSNQLLAPFRVSQPASQASDLLAPILEA